MIQRGYSCNYKSNKFSGNALKLFLYIRYFTRHISPVWSQTCCLDQAPSLCSFLGLVGLKNRNCNFVV